MKKLFVSMLIFAFALSGCAGLNLNTPTGGSVADTAILTTIELGGYELGLMVGKSKTPDDDKAIAEAYKVARTGQLTPEIMANALKALKINDAALAGRLEIILKNMGATFTPTGDLLALTGIPMAYWDKSAEGYMLGYEFGKANQKTVGVSAVKLYWPGHGKIM